MESQDPGKKGSGVEMDASGQAAVQQDLGFFGLFAANVRSTGRNPVRVYTGFALSWAAFFLILFVMPTTEGLTPAGKACLAVVVWASLTWVFETVPVGITGLLIPMLMVLANVVPFKETVTGFVSKTGFIALAAFILAAVVQVSGLDRRIALGLLSKARVSSVNGVIWLMSGVNMVLAPFLPGAHSRAAIFLPIINGINQLFGNTERDDNGRKAIVIQTMVYSTMVGGMCILTAHMPNLVIVGLFNSELKLNISYFDWFTLQWPYLGMFVVTQWWVQHFFKTRHVRIEGGTEFINRQKSALPKTSQAEKLILIVFIVIALLWMTESFHKIPTHISALIGLALLFIPGLFGFGWKEIQDKTIWGTYLMFGGALSMSSAMGATGLGKWLADLVYPIAAGHPWWMILAILMVGTHIIRIGMLSNVAAVALFAPVLLSLAPKFNLHPVAFTMLVADTDTFAYILPTQITSAVIAYSTGTFSFSDYAKVGVVSVMLAICYGILVIAPWYAIMGIPVWDPTAPWPF